jgi:alkaline phosphatase D
MKAFLSIGMLLFSVCTINVCAQPFLGQGVMAGELTQTSVILQSRLTRSATPTKLVNGDLPGQAGIARFQLSLSRNFDKPFYTNWIKSVPLHDYIVKAKVDKLSPHTRYYYRVVFGLDKNRTTFGNTCTFRTLPQEDAVEPIRFVVITGMNYHRFHHPNRKWAYQGPDKHLGYPGLDTIRKAKPDFLVATGDNVYYDHKPKAKSVAQMRQKWHEQFGQARYLPFFAQVPVYWEKDDHDYRFDDADRTNDRRKLPTHENGLAIFREQVPVIDPGGSDAVMYRTYRLGKLAQIWMTEGRDYRSPNLMPDGPGKTLWGKEQLAWLKRTLSESDATFKLLVSPTPMVGPDELRKKDNHTNIGGFRHEGDAFFKWLGDNGFLDKNFYFLCGDRHWQYHAVHPSGFEEFSCGALVDANARMGRKPADPKSTDPDGKIVQRYTYDKPTGGFLLVEITPGKNGTAKAAFIFKDENGKELYREEKTAGQ